MQEKFNKKIVIPVIALAIVGIAGATYTISHSGPITAHAASVTTTPQQASPDKETQDDAVNQNQAKATNQTADSGEKEQPDKQRVKEGEDNN
ncbi:MAG: hypothetical protein ACR2LN_07150 [Candidatus Levyibacteriota bacterium]